MLTTIESWQQPAWQQYLKYCENQRLPHGLLLIGPEGVGKYQFAKSIAASAMCLSPQNYQACGQCKSCQLSEHPDLVSVELLEKSKQIKIDQVRELTTWLQQSKHISHYKIAIIRHADRMHYAAANAILKQLEEPRDNVILILLASNIQHVPATIISRCQKINLLGTTQLGDMQIDGIDPEQMKQALHLSGGAPEGARELCETNGLDEFNKYVIAMEQLLDGRLTAIKLAQTQQEYSQVLSWQLFLMQQIILAEYSPTNAVLACFPTLSQFIAKFPVKKIELCYYLLDDINDALAKKNLSMNQQLRLESLYVKWIGSMT